MPWLEQHPTSGRFKVCFRWGGRQFKKTVKAADRGQALAVLKRVEENLGWPNGAGWRSPRTPTSRPSSSPTASCPTSPGSSLRPGR